MNGLNVKIYCKWFVWPLVRKALYKCSPFTIDSLYTDHYIVHYLGDKCIGNSSTNCTVEIYRRDAYRSRKQADKCEASPLDTSFD